MSNLELQFWSHKNEFKSINERFATFTKLYFIHEVFNSWQSWIIFSQSSLWWIWSTSLRYIVPSLIHAIRLLAIPLIFEQLRTQKWIVFHIYPVLLFLDNCPEFLRNERVFGKIGKSSVSIFAVSPRRFRLFYELQQYHFNLLHLVIVLHTTTTTTNIRVRNKKKILY